jgi:hypothetical protein
MKTICKKKFENEILSDKLFRAFVKSTTGGVTLKRNHAALWSILTLQLYVVHGLLADEKYSCSSRLTSRQNLLLKVSKFKVCYLTLQLYFTVY